MSENDHKETNFPVASTLVCPKCGHSQPLAEECTRCGVIFSKIHSHGNEPLGTSVSASSITYYDLVKERKQWILLAVLLIVLAGLLYHTISTREIKHPPGVLVATEPKQLVIPNPQPWRKGNRLVVPIARFALQARVLSKERYHFDTMADLSPVDVALGWGPMSDQQVLDQLEIGQGSRRYILCPRQNRSPLPMDRLLATSSNMHMLPATNEIKSRLFSLRRGNVIEMTGYLVGIQEDGQWTWMSSLSRTDTGDGACEIVWVETLKVR